MKIKRRQQQDEEEEEEEDDDDSTEDFPPRSSFIRVGGRLNTTSMRRTTSRSRSTSTRGNSKRSSNDSITSGGIDDPRGGEQDESVHSNHSNVQEEGDVMMPLNDAEKSETNNEINELLPHAPSIEVIETCSVTRRINMNGTTFVSCLIGFLWMLTMCCFYLMLRRSLDIQRDLQTKLDGYILGQGEWRAKDYCAMCGTTARRGSSGREDTKDRCPTTQPTQQLLNNNIHGIMMMGLGSAFAFGNPILLLSGFCIVVLLSITILDHVMDSIHRTTKLSKLYNSRGEVIQAQSSWWQRRGGFRSNNDEGNNNTLLPFLPDDKYASKESHDLILKYLMHQQRLRQRSKQDSIKDSSTNLQNRKSWALVTGASRGIGRAIVVSLARRDIPIVLVARHKKLLEQLSKLVEDCYGVQTHVIASDLCEKNAARDIVLELQRNEIHVDILFNNAGVGDTRELVTMSSSKIDALCQLNVTTTTHLTQILGSKMKEKGSGRIAFVSSLAGAVPGVPHAAVYAAAKAYQKSLATSLGREMESSGVGVTCIMPGAVRGTEFASNANMEDAAIWEFPFGILDPETVAECAVDAVILGRRMVVVGWMNALLAGILTRLLPSRCIVFLCEFGWKALPFTRKKRKRL